MISDIINEVKKSFGEISVVRGNKRAFLRTNIKIKDNTIQIGIIKNLEECIEMFGEGVSKMVTYPATKNFSK